MRPSVGHICIYVRIKVQVIYGSLDQVPSPCLDCTYLRAWMTEQYTDKGRTEEGKQHGIWGKGKGSCTSYYHHPQPPIHGRQDTFWGEGQDTRAVNSF